MESDEVIQNVLDLVKDYLQGHDLLVQSYSHSSLKKTTDLRLPLEGMGIENVLSDLEQFIKYSIKTNHPGFMNPLWGGLNIAAFAGEIIASLTNNSMYTYELSPVATLMEEALVARMCEIVGFSDGTGTLTTGGSNGNMIGLMCARHKADPLGLRKGYNGSDMVCFVSSESHYSVVMAATVLGIGRNNIVSVGCDQSGKMRVDKLIEEIEFASVNGQTPFCVIATSGTTVRGAFDPLREISEVCENYDLWLHVDAAWGGSCLFSSKYRGLMDGVEFADSVCWDAHKMMGIPLVCSAFLIKNPSILRTVCSFTDAAHYLFQTESSDVDLGRLSLQCGRRNDALKLFLAWREKGDAGWARMVESYMEMADYLESLVERTEELELVSQREWANVCLRFVASDGDLELINKKIREQLKSDGRFMVSSSKLDDKTILRPVIANQNVSRETLDDLVYEITRMGNSIVKELP